MGNGSLVFENETEVPVYIHARPLGDTLYIRVFDYAAENTKLLAPGKALSYPVDERVKACLSDKGIYVDFSVKTKVKGASLGIACVMGKGVFRFVPSS